MRLKCRKQSTLIYKLCDKDYKDKNKEVKCIRQP